MLFRSNSPWPAGDVVYVLDKSGQLICVNRDNGQVYWLTDLNKGRGRTEDKSLGMFGGRTVKPIWSGPILVDNRLVLVNDWGEAMTFDAKTGEHQKTLKLGDPSYIAPIAYDGMVYVVTDKGDLIAIR